MQMDVIYVHFNSFNKTNLHQMYGDEMEFSNTGVDPVSMWSGNDGNMKLHFCTFSLKENSLNSIKAAMRQIRMQIGSILYRGHWIY